MSKKAFTLIEMLTVIFIIGLLASIVVMGVTSARAKARDAKRISDINAVASTLQAYYSDNHNYPNAGATYSGLTTFLAPAYSASLPQDPKNTGEYIYYYSSDSSTYTLAACLERTQGATGNVAGKNCSVATYALINGEPAPTP